MWCTHHFFVVITRATARPCNECACQPSEVLIGSHVVILLDHDANWDFPHMDQLLTSLQDSLHTRKNNWEIITIHTSNGVRHTSSLTIAYQKIICSTCVSNLGILHALALSVDSLAWWRTKQRCASLPTFFSTRSVATSPRRILFNSFWAIKQHQRTLVIARGFCCVRWFRSCVFSREITSTKLCLPIMLELLPTHDSHQDKLFSSLQSLLLCWCDADLKETEIVKDFRTQEQLEHLWLETQIG